MSLTGLSWAMAQDVGSPGAKLALIMMAEKAGGDGRLDIYSGTPAELARACCMDERDLSRSLLLLQEEGLVEPFAAGSWLIGAQRSLPPAAQRASGGQQRGARVPRSVRQRVYERDEYRCVLCGSPDDLTIDHIVPRVAGGGNDEANLQTLCRPCNSRKGAHC